MIKIYYVEEYRYTKTKGVEEKVMLILRKYRVH